MNDPRPPRSSRSRLFTAGAAVAVLTVSSGCGLFGGDDEDDATDEDRFVSMINDGIALESDLNDAENRYVRQCMDDQGFSIHDPFELQSWDFDEAEELAEHYPGSEAMLTTAEAEEDAFGAWKSAPETDFDGEEEEDGQLDAEIQDELDEFESQGQSYQRDYYIALLGEPLADHQYPHLDPEVGEITEENEAGLHNDGEAQPEPEGCRGELIDTVYGGGQIVTEEIDGQEYSYYTHRPERPASMNWEEKLDGFQSDEVVETQLEFENCLAEGDLNDWTFDDQGQLDPQAYFMAMYFGDSGGMPSDWHSGPEPDPNMTDYEEIKDYEFDTAAQFAQCNEETEAGESLRQAWLDAELEELRELESEILSWEEQMEGYLEDLQELIAE